MSEDELMRELEKSVKNELSEMFDVLDGLSASNEQTVSNVHSTNQQRAEGSHHNPYRRRH